MLLKTVICIVIAILGGCLLAVFFLIPEESTVSVVEVAEQSTGLLREKSDVQFSEIVVSEDPEKEDRFLRSRIKGGEVSRLDFSMDQIVSPLDRLRLNWRAHGETDHLEVKVRLMGEPEGVFYTNVSAPPETWTSTDIPLELLVADREAVESLSTAGGETFKIIQFGLELSPSSQMQLDLREILLVRTIPRWRSAKAILSLGGVLILALVAISLIGKQVRTERSLKSSDTYYRSIFNAVSEAIFVLDIKNGTVLDVNDRACQIFDETREGFLLSDVEGIVAGTIKRDPLSWIRKALKGEDSRFEWRGRTKEGEDLWLEFNLKKSAIGGEERLLAVVRDIKDEKQAEGERQRLEQQLLHAQKLEAIGQLAGGVAHDFNNILTSITCSTDLALRDLPPQSLPASGFRQIADLTQRATTLTRQLLAFSRQQALRPTIQSLNQLIENALKMLTRMIGEDVQLKFVPAAQPDTVRADSGQIEQVLMNLAINARDAMPGGGTLTIETSNVVVDRDHPADVEPGAFIKLSVTDTGEGMDQETRERIFEPFFTTKEVGKGTGLGLSTVYGIVRQHRGDILFDSQLDEGTVFHILLPVADERVQEIAQRPAEVIPDGSETILLVEDDLNAREIIERVLKSQGYNVYRAASAREAKQLFSEHLDEIDLLLTDIVMPGEDGVGLYRSLEERNSGLRVLFMSGYTARGSLQNEVLRPGLPFIAKPFGPTELARKIREVLEVRPGLEPPKAPSPDASHLGV